MKLVNRQTCHLPKCKTRSSTCVSLWATIEPCGGTSCLPYKMDERPSGKSMWDAPGQRLQCSLQKKKHSAQGKIFILSLVCLLTILLASPSDQGLSKTGKILVIMKVIWKMQFPILGWIKPIYLSKNVIKIKFSALFKASPFFEYHIYQSKYTF